MGSHTTTPELQHDNENGHDESYAQQLFKYTFDEGRQEPRFLIFRGLQLMNIFNLQNDLAKLKHDIMTAKAATPQQTDSLTKVLHNYSTSTPNPILPTHVLSPLLPSQQPQSATTNTSPASPPSPAPKPAAAAWTSNASSATTTTSSSTKAQATAASRTPPCSPPTTCARCSSAASRAP